MQAYVLRAQMTSWLTLFTHTGLYPSHRAACAPSTSRPQYRCETWNEPAGQANIERLRKTDLRDRHRNGIAGNGVHRPAAGSQGAFARRNSPEQFARQGHAPGFTRTARKLSSRAVACGEQFPQRGRTPEFASQLDAQGQQGTKKRRSEERRPSRITTGANQIRPES